MLPAHSGFGSERNESPADRIRVLAGRIAEGERKLSGLRPVWPSTDPLMVKWLGLLAEYEALVLEHGEP